MYETFMAANANCLWNHKRFIDTYFSQFDGKYFKVMGVKEIKMGIIGLQVE